MSWTAAGSPNVQRFVSMVPHHGAQYGVYVTTSSFTKAAQELARQYRIRLIDGHELSRMVENSRQAGRFGAPVAAPLDRERITPA